jgi:hypothetical protein
VPIDALGQVSHTFAGHLQMEFEDENALGVSFITIVTALSNL